MYRENPSWRLRLDRVGGTPAGRGTDANPPHRPRDVRLRPHRRLRHRLQATSAKSIERRDEATIPQIAVEACALTNWWIGQQNDQELRTWYATATFATIAQELDRWIEKVQVQGPQPLRKTLSAFKNWRPEILAFFQFLPLRISNGYAEGQHSRARALMRQASGYRNRRHLRLRILLDGAA